MRLKKQDAVEKLDAVEKDKIGCIGKNEMQLERKNGMLQQQQKQQGPFLLLCTADADADEKAADEDKTLRQVLQKMGCSVAAAAAAAGVISIPLHC